MSAKNNVNPDQYQQRGRDRQGEDVVHDIHKQTYAQSKKNEEGSEFIPGQQPQPVNEKPMAAGAGATGDVTDSANSSSNDS